jgi:hypothetical protein
MGRAQQGFALSATTARDYASHLLSSLGVSAPVRPFVEEHPAISWARSGMMALTGAPDGAPQMCPVPLTACADGALAALASLAPDGAFDEIRGSSLLAERAAIAGFLRAGSVSPGGSCCLLEAADGWLAVNLTRDTDWELVPAWLEVQGEPDWSLVKRELREKPVRELVERARLLGLAVALEEPDGSHRAWFNVERRPAREPRLDVPLVVDLSSLWAGPLCTQLLYRAGARVIKVESARRPDGARRGVAEFFDLLNAGKENVVLDFSLPEERAQLRSLLVDADIVIEGSRPRALRQLGFVAEEIIAQNPRQTWIGITGYGRGEPEENWIAFGDDAGVAAGLSRVMFEATREHLICGDAIADPLTGLHAALAAWAGYRRGGAGLVSVSLRDVVRNCIEFDQPADWGSRQREWIAVARAAGARPSGVGGLRNNLRS